MLGKVNSSKLRRPKVSIVYRFKVSIFRKWTKRGSHSPKRQGKRTAS